MAVRRVRSTRVSFKLSPSARAKIKSLRERYSRLNATLKRARQTKSSFRSMPKISGGQRAEYVDRANEEIKRLNNRIAEVNREVNKVHLNYNQKANLRKNLRRKTA